MYSQNIFTEYIYTFAQWMIPDHKFPTHSPHSPHSPLYATLTARKANMTVNSTQIAYI